MLLLVIYFKSVFFYNLESYYNYVVLINAFVNKCIVRKERIILHPKENIAFQQLGQLDWTKYF